MNIKHLIKPVAVLAFVCGAPALHAQILGGNAGGGLGGSLGGTLGGGMGSIGGMGQGNGTGAIGGGIDRTDALRRHATGAVERTRDATGNVRDRVSTLGARPSAALPMARRCVRQRNGIAGGMNTAGNAAGAANGSLSGVTGRRESATRRGRSHRVARLGEGRCDPRRRRRRRAAPSQLNRSRRPRREGERQRIRFADGRSRRAEGRTGECADQPQQLHLSGERQRQCERQRGATRR